MVVLANAKLLDIPLEKLNTRVSTQAIRHFRVVYVPIFLTDCLRFQGGAIAMGRKYTQAMANRFARHMWACC